MRSALVRKAAHAEESSSVPAVVRKVLASPARPLQADARTFFESRFAHDFSRVRVHDDAAAAASARAVHASAYTVGQHVVMGTRDEGLQRSLLAHELGHAMQQPAYDGSSELRVDDSQEHGVEDMAKRVLDPSMPPAAGPVGRAAEAHVARRGPMPAPVRPPPARGPIQTVPSGPRGVAGGPSQGPLLAPDPYDTSFQAMLDRANIRSYADRQRIAAERPVATLERGGQAPSFISEQGWRTYAWMGGPGGGGSVQARVRRFHVLDAIDHAVDQVTREDQLQGVILTFLPDRAFLILGVATGQTLPLVPTLVFRPLQDEPLYPTNFDPQGLTRLQVIEAAVERRARTVPALAQSRVTPRGRRQGPCRIEPIEPMGDDPLSSIYCHATTGSPYSYRITILSPTTGNATQRWAEIDALRGNTWFECKCGYEALLSGAARGQGVANAVLNRLDHQVLNHLEIARTCGLQYRYIVSNDSVAERLRERWFGNVVIDVRPFDPCD